MAAKKESPAPDVTPLDSVRRVVAFCLGPGRPIAVVALVGMILYGAFYAAWYWAGVGQRIPSTPPYTPGNDEFSRSYILTLDGLEITPPPPWVKRDVRREGFDHARLDGPLSIMDDRLIDRLRNVFALHPWVARVREVHKYHPARVKIDLEYRRPVCMVEVPGGLYPVDVEGTWLPSDFTPVEASQYPRLSGIDTAPMGSVGTRWGDARVVGGAEIADAVSSVWQTFQLAVIRPLPAAGSVGTDHCTFELYTRGGTRIIWGRAPSTSPAGELPAAEKIARLRHYFQEHNTLDSAQGRQDIDVRPPQSILVTPAASKQP